MKIGILTFHRALNYGALLQAYALQETLANRGNQAEIIDYQCEPLEKPYYYPSFSERKSLKDKLKFIIQGKNELGRRERFEAFRKKWLHLSQPYDEKTVSAAADRYDRFVTGSDQVFNYKAHDFDRTFFLDFVKDPKKKYSYAASFGLSRIPEEYAEAYCGLLSSFARCSVREKQGVEILKALGINGGRIDLDPTFLLTKDQWIQKFDLQKKQENYIFAYYFELTPSLKAFVEKLAKETGLKVKYLGCAFRNPFACRCESIPQADPVDFVDAVYNAKYVVTNSFHGTAFSINFNKTFFVELLQTGASVNSRLTNILSITGLENRILADSGSMQPDTGIAWNVVNDKIKTMREDSIAFIRSEFT